MPKYDSIDGNWALKPYDLGPWTIRGCLIFGFSGVHEGVAAFLRKSFPKVARGRSGPGPRV